MMMMMMMFIDIINISLIITRHQLLPMRDVLTATQAAVLAFDRRMDHVLDHEIWTPQPRNWFTIVGDSNAWWWISSFSNCCISFEFAILYIFVAFLLGFKPAPWPAAFGPRSNARPVPKPANADPLGWDSGKWKNSGPPSPSVHASVARPQQAPSLVQPGAAQESKAKPCNAPMRSNAEKKGGTLQYAIQQSKPLTIATSCCTFSVGSSSATSSSSSGPFTRQCDCCAHFGFKILKAS